MDTLGFVNLWSEMAERDSLLQAQSLSSQSQRHLQQAHALQPSVQVPPPPDVVRPEWLNVVFDNIYTVSLAPTGFS